MTKNKPFISYLPLVSLFIFIVCTSHSLAQNFSSVSTTTPTVAPSPSADLKITPGKIVTAAKDFTIFSLPGYDDLTYAANAHTFTDLRDLGLGDMIPRRLAYPKKDDKLEIIEFIPPATTTSNKVTYVKIKHTDTDGTTVEGYARVDLFILPIEVQTTEAALCTDCNKPNTCEENNLSVICQAHLFNDLGSDLLQFTDRFKSEDERTAYFEKYKECEKGPALHEKYLNEYRHYIREAAKAFQIPDVLLACLIFKESHWDKNAVSKATPPAKGIAQFVPNTSDYINTIISSLDADPARLSIHRKNKALYENLVKENFDRKAKGLPMKRIPSIVRSNYNWAVQLLKKERLAQKWKKYIDQLAQNPTFKQNYPTKPWSGSYPTRFNQDRALNPALAIGASALYIKDLINIMEIEFDEGSIKGEKQLLNFLTAVAGVYNRGPAQLDRIGNPPPATTDKWVEIIGRNNLQAKAHMESIKRCMEKGNNLPQKEIDSAKRTIVDQGPCNEK